MRNGGQLVPGGWQRLDDAVVLRLRRAHPDVDAAWPGDVLAQHVGERATVDPTHELVGEDPDRQGVVEERLPRMPERALGGEPLGQRCVVPAAPPT